MNGIDYSRTAVKLPDFGQDLININLECFLYVALTCVDYFYCTTLLLKCTICMLKTTPYTTVNILLIY